MDISSNLAYDYKKFEESKVPKVAAVKTHVQHKRQGLMLAKAIICMTAVILMLSALIYTKVVQSELGLDYNAAQKQLNELEGENSRLQIQMEKEFSQAAIEEIASKELKMKKLDNSKIEYIEFDSKDKAKVIEAQSVFDKIIGWFVGLIG